MFKVLLCCIVGREDICYIMGNLEDSKGLNIRKGLWIYSWKFRNEVFFLKERVGV